MALDWTGFDVSSLNRAVALDLLHFGLFLISDKVIYLVIWDSVYGFCYSMDRGDDVVVVAVSGRWLRELLDWASALDTSEEKWDLVWGIIQEGKGDKKNRNNRS